MLAALAPGRSVLHGALTSEDARSTARVLRQLGADITPLRTGVAVDVTGHKRFSATDRVLDCGNSGTTARLMLGLLAAQRFSATMTGDRSLRRRPMRRVTEPLTVMGARIAAGANDGLPLRITGGALHALDWRLPVASAQIKSALLLAGAIGGVTVTLRQPAATRDHTERMLRQFDSNSAVAAACSRPSPPERSRAVRTQHSWRPVVGDLSPRGRSAVAKGVDQHRGGRAQSVAHRLHCGARTDGDPGCRLPDRS